MEVQKTVNVFIARTYQRESTRHEQGRVEDKKKASLCNSFVTIALLQWLLCNGFCFSRLPMFTSKATIFLGDGLFRQGFLSPGRIFPYWLAGNNGW